MTADWLHGYNHHRPHEALGRIPPVGFRVKQLRNLYSCLEQEFEEASSCRRTDKNHLVFAFVN